MYITAKENKNQLDALQRDLKGNKILNYLYHEIKNKISGHDKKDINNVLIWIISECFFIELYKDGVGKPFSEEEVNAFLGNKMEVLNHQIKKLFRQTHEENINSWDN